MQYLNSHLTTWHIIWGTYGARLHGGMRATVDKTHNQKGEPFVEQNMDREDCARDRMKTPPVLLTRMQREFIEELVPSVCERGGWMYRTCAAASNHIHIILDIDPRVHGEKVRRLLKRWIGQELGGRWPLPEGASWWAEEGSNTAIHDERYLNNAYDYVDGQRTSRPIETHSAQHGAGDGPARTRGAES